MSNQEEVGIKLKDVTLTYSLYFDRTQTLKELVINKLYRRRFTERENETLRALNDVNLEIRHGERLGIIGHNGAGKSTLLKVIAGILKPTEGDVTVVGNVQPLIEIAAGFNPEFSGRENIYLNGYMLGFTRQQIAAKEKEIIEFSELEKFIDVPVKYYSSGMSVRLAFTIATSIEPEYLIFDEMLSAGDASFFVKARARMDSLLEKAKILVVVSHDLTVIDSLCSRALVMQHGRIIFDGPPADAVRFYKESLSLTAPEQEPAPIEIGELKVAERDGDLIATCVVHCRAPISASAEIEIGPKGYDAMLRSRTSVDLCPDHGTRLEILARGLSDYEGALTARVKIDFNTDNGTQSVFSPVCEFQLGHPRTYSTEAIWTKSSEPGLL